MSYLGGLYGPQATSLEWTFSSIKCTGVTTEFDHEILRFEEAKKSIMPAILYGYLTSDVGNPYIVYGISVNKFIYREQLDDKPYIAIMPMVHGTHLHRTHF